MENTHKEYDGFGSMGGSRTISMPVKVYNILNKYKSKFNKLLKNYIDDYLRYNVDDHEQMKFKFAYSQNLGGEHWRDTFNDFDYQWLVYNADSLRNENEDKPHLKFITSQLRVNWNFGSEKKSDSYLFKIAITKKEAKILRYEYRNIYDYFRDLKYKMINSKDAYKYASDIF